MFRSSAHFALCAVRTTAIVLSVSLLFPHCTYAQEQKLGYTDLRYNVSSQVNIYKSVKYKDDALTPVNLGYNTASVFTNQTYHTGLLPFGQNFSYSNSDFAVASSFLNTSNSDIVLNYMPNSELVGINQFLISIEIPCIGGATSTYDVSFDQTFNSLTSEYTQELVSALASGKTYAFNLGNFNTDTFEQQHCDFSFSANSDGSALTVQTSS